MDLLRLLPFEQQRQVINSQGNLEYIAATELMLYFGWEIPDSAKEIKEDSLRNALAVLRKFYRDKDECEQYRKELAATATSTADSQKQNAKRGQTSFNQYSSEIQLPIDDQSYSYAKRKEQMEELERTSASITQQVLSPSFLTTVSKQQYNILATKYEAEKERARGLEKQAGNFKRELENAYQKLTYSDAQEQDLKAKLDERNLEILVAKADFSREIEQLKEQMKSDHEKSESCTRELYGFLNKANESNKAYQDQLQKQADYLQALRQENQKTCGDLKELRKNLADAEAQAQQLTSYLEKATTDLKHQISLLEDADTKLAKYERDLYEEQERYNNSETARKSLDNKVKEFNKSVIELLDEKNKQKSSMERQIYESEAQKKQCINQISELTVELTKLRDEKWKLIEACDKLTAQVAVARESEDRLTKEKADDRKRLREYKKKNEELYHDLSGYKSKFKQQENEVQSLSARKAELESQLTDMRQKEAEASGKVWYLQQTKASDSAKLSDLERQLAECVGCRDKLKSESEEVSRSKVQLQEKFYQAIKIFDCMMMSAFEQLEPPRDLQEWLDTINSQESAPDFKNELLKVASERKAFLKEKRDLETRLEKCRYDKETMAQNLEKLRNEMDRCKLEKSEADKKLGHCSLALQSLEDSFDHLRASYKDERDGQIAILGSSCRGFEQQIGDLSREIAEKDGRIALLKRQLQKAKLALFNMHESNQMLLDGVTRLRNEQNASAIDSLVEQYDESNALDCNGSDGGEYSHEDRHSANLERISGQARETETSARQKAELYAKIQALEANLAAQQRMADSGSRQSFLEISRLRQENQRLYLQVSMAQTGAQPYSTKPTKPTKPARAFASAQNAGQDADLLASAALKSQVQAMKERQSELENQLASAGSTVRERDEAIKKLQAEIEGLKAALARAQDELKKKAAQIDLERQSTQVERDLDAIIQNNSLLGSGPIAVRSPVARPLGSDAESDLIRQNAELRAQLEQLCAKGDQALVERVRELEEVCEVSHMVENVQERLRRDKKVQELEMTIKRLKQNNYPNIDEMQLNIQNAHQLLSAYVEYDDSLAARIYKMLSKLTAERDRQISASPYKRIIPELRSMFLQNVITAQKFGERVDDALLKEMSQLYARYFDQLQRLFVDANMDFSSTVREMKAVQAELSKALVD